MKIDVKEVKKNPDKFLEGENLKEILKDSQMVVELLKTKDVNNYKVIVDGEPVYLVRPEGEENKSSFS
ncbi:MAG: hypothetical protein ACOX08_11545 [Methanobacterium sp.]|jgi:hypothetical protein